MNEIDQRYESNVNKAHDKLEEALKSGDEERIKKAQAELENARGVIRSANYNKDNE